MYIYLAFVDSSASIPNRIVLLASAMPPVTANCYICILFFIFLFNIRDKGPEDY